VNSLFVGYILVIIKTTNKMKTPYLDEIMATLEMAINLEVTTPKFRANAIQNVAELKAIKSIIENTPIVSTPEKPVWVVDEYGNKCILFTDLGDKVIDNRFIVVPEKHQNNFLQGKSFIYNIREIATPYTPKVNIEVTEEEAVKVEEFLKTLRK
jgi:hypothetical protein